MVLFTHRADQRQCPVREGGRGEVVTTGTGAARDGRGEDAECGQTSEKTAHKRDSSLDKVRM